MAEGVTDLVAEMRKRAGLVPPAELTVDYSEFADLVPDDDAPTYVRTEADEEIDLIIRGVDILEAYQRWCGKMIPSVNGKRESIMISCPIPGHKDNDPSACINTDKQTWYCNGCCIGGDKFDIAAWYFDFPVPGYKGKDFPALRKRMAEDLGYIVKTTLTGKVYVSPPVEPTPEPLLSEPPENFNSTGVISSPPEPVIPAQPEPDPNVIPLPGADEDRSYHESYFHPIPWGQVLQEGTFIYDWMQLAAEDDLPLEYYFWLGMQSLGFAAGHETVLNDMFPVKGNLFLCLVGPTGLGKSRAIQGAMGLIREALPYDPEIASGTKITPTPNSPEVLIDNFSFPIYDDPTNPTKITGYKSVRGLVRFDELASLVNKSDKVGSNIKPTLMEFYDNYSEVSTESRGKGVAVAKSPFCQVVTSTQPKSIASLMRSADEYSGFLNRWVFAFGKPRKLTAYRGVLLDPTACADTLRDLRTWCLTGHQMNLEFDALDRWTSFFETILEPMKLSDDEPMLSRIDLLMKKLILLFAVNAKELNPSLATVERAIALYEYITWTYGCMRKAMGDTPTAEARELIIRRCQEHFNATGKHPSMRDIRRYTGKLDLQVVTRTIKMMCEIGDLDEKSEAGQRGPKTVRYEYVG